MGRRRARRSPEKCRKGRAEIYRSQRNSLQKELMQLKRTVPFGNEMDMDTFCHSVGNYILLLEAKLTLLKNLSTICGL